MLTLFVNVPHIVPEAGSMRDLENAFDKVKKAHGEKG